MTWQDPRPDEQHRPIVDHVSPSTTSDRLGGWLDRHRLAVDSAGTLVLLVGCLVTGTAIRITTALTEASQTPLALAATLGIVAPLAVRRTRPVLSAVIVYCAALSHLLLGVVLVVPADLLVLAALYSVTVHGPRWAYRVAALGAAIGSSVVATMIVASDRSSTRTAVVLLVVMLLLFLATWSFALVRRARREQIAALHDRADRLERERDQQALIAASAERTRIAREMHDIVAHSLSVVVAQADGGRYAAASDPQAAGRALATISETGRAALADMRRLLGILRADTTGQAGRAADAVGGTPSSLSDGPAERSPQPDIDGITALVEQVRATGVKVSYGTTGVRRELPPGAALTVHRVCQEALTNVLKHAGPDVTASVMLMWHPDRIVLQVSDDGRGAAATSDGAGHGVIGMSERAAIFAGTLTAGPRPGGGYRVVLTLPLPDAPSGTLSGAFSTADGHDDPAAAPAATRPPTVQEASA